MGHVGVAGEAKWEGGEWGEGATAMSPSFGVANDQ
jgi:hypothetical protein